MSSFSSGDCCDEARESLALRSRSDWRWLLGCWPLPELCGPRRAWSAALCDDSFTRSPELAAKPSDLAAFLLADDPAVEESPKPP